MNLNQVTIPSLDVKKSVEFYELLGLEPIVKALPKYARFECPDGDATFSVHLVEKLSDQDGVIVYFEEEDLDQYVEELVELGIEFDEMPEDRDWLWREARLKDPDGNELILYHASENRKNPPWRIDKS